MRDRRPVGRAIFVLAMFIVAAGILALPEILGPVSGPPASSTTSFPGPTMSDQEMFRDPIATAAPIEPIARAGGLVTGRVVDGLGLPVPGCNVVLGQLLDRPVLDPDPTATPTGRASTDVEGRFRLEHPGGTSLMLMMNHPDFPPSPGAHGLELTSGQSIDVGDLVLRSQPGLVVRASSAASGGPLQGALVELEPLLEDAFLPDAVRALRRRAARTGIDGRATIYGLRAGRYRLRVAAEDHAAVEVLLTQPDDGGRAPDQIVSLPPGVALWGWVHDANGVPVSGALLRAEPLPAGTPAQPTRTDQDGGFLIPNLQRLPHRLIVESRSHGQLIREPVDVGEAALTIRMPAGLSIRGRLHSDLVPVSGARVEALPAAGWPVVVDGAVFRPSATTDADGNFEIGGLPEGRFLLRIESKGFAPPDPDPVDAGAAAITLNLRRTGQVTGKVLDPGGRPLGGAQIEVLRSDHDGTSFSTLLDRVVHGRDPLPRAETGRGGRFLIGDLPPGSYLLRIRNDDLAPWVSDPFEVPAGRSRTLPTATMQRGAAISGRALRADGSAAAGALVVADPASGNRPGTPGCEVTAGPDGTYSVGPLAAGSYELFYYFPRGQTAAESAESRRSTMTRVRLQPGARLGQDLIYK